MMFLPSQPVPPAAPVAFGAESGGMASMLPGLLMAAGVALLIVFALVSLRNRSSKDSEESPQKLHPREKLERMRQTQGMRDDMRQMMVDLEELTRRFSSQLDTKSVQLEKLLEKADERIAELQRLQGSDNGSPAGDENSAPAGQRPRQDAGGGAAGPGSANADEPEEPDDPLTAEIYRRSDAGESATQIARHLNEQPGKIELILALRQKA